MGQVYTNIRNALDSAVNQTLTDIAYPSSQVAWPGYEVKGNPDSYLRISHRGPIGFSMTLGTPVIHHYKHWITVEACVKKNTSHANVISILDSLLETFHSYSKIQNTIRIYSELPVIEQILPKDDYDRYALKVKFHVHEVL